MRLSREVPLILEAGEISTVSTEMDCTFAARKQARCVPLMIDAAVRDGLLFEGC